MPNTHYRRADIAVNLVVYNMWLRVTGISTLGCDKFLIELR